MKKASWPAPAWNRRILVAVTDKMARSILDTPQVRNAHSPPVVVLDPVMNETRFPINKDMFLTRIQVLLNSKCEKKVQFLARDRLAALERERDLKRSGQVTSSSDPSVVEFKGGDFLLTGKLQSLTTRNSRGISDYVLYSFELVDAPHQRHRLAGLCGDQKAGAGRRGLSLSAALSSGHTVHENAGAVVSGRSAVGRLRDDSDGRKLAAHRRSDH